MQIAPVLSHEVSRKGFSARRERYRRNWREWRRARKLAAKAGKVTQSATVDAPKPIVLSAVPEPVHEVRKLVSMMAATQQLALPDFPAFPGQDDVVEVLVRECGCKTVTCLAQGSPEECGCDMVGASCSGCKDAHFNIPCRIHRGSTVKDFSVLSTREVRRYH
jgi:hypothetical protein